MSKFKIVKSIAFAAAAGLMTTACNKNSDERSGYTDKSGSTQWGAGYQNGIASGSQSRMESNGGLDYSSDSLKVGAGPITREGDGDIGNSSNWSESDQATGPYDNSRGGIGGTGIGSSGDTSDMGVSGYSDTSLSGTDGYSDRSSTGYGGSMNRATEDSVKVETRSETKKSKSKKTKPRVHRDTTIRDSTMIDNTGFPSGTNGMGSGGSSGSGGSGGVGSPGVGSGSGGSGLGGAGGSVGTPGGN